MNLIVVIKNAYGYDIVLKSLGSNFEGHIKLKDMFFVNTCCLDLDIS